ncbi:hypothetical protein JCM10296v2_002153 [Rhodotorula toruloides]
MVRTVRLSPTVSIPQLGYGAMGDNRAKVIVTTKWGVRWENGAMVVDGSPEYARQCIDQSIENLGSVPDMWLLHRIDKKIPVEESVKAMEEARQAGKCKYIGLSAMSANTLRRAAKVAKIDFVEVEFSPFETSIRNSGGDRRLQGARRQDLRVLASRSRFEDVQKDGDVRGAGAFPRLSKEVWDHNFKLVEAFEKLAEKKGCKPSQLVLAWIVTVHGDLIIPIPGVRVLFPTSSQIRLTLIFDASADQIHQIPRGELRLKRRRPLTGGDGRDPSSIKENPIKGAQYNEKNLAMLDE